MRLYVSFYKRSLDWSSIIKVRQTHGLTYLCSLNSTCLQAQIRNNWFDLSFQIPTKENRGFSELSTAIPPHFASAHWYITALKRTCESYQLKYLLHRFYTNEYIWKFIYKLKLLPTLGAIIGSSPEKCKWSRIHISNESRALIFYKEMVERAKWWTIS